MPKNAAHGRIVWHDLTTTDIGAAKSFYTQITPWSTRPWEDVKHYEVWMLGDDSIGGVGTSHVTGRGPQWLPVVCVYDVDATARQAESLGGRIVQPPKEVPYVGCWAVIDDPQGAPIGVFEPADVPPGHDGEARIGEFSWHELATGDYKAAAEFYRALFRWEKTSEYDMGESGIYYMFGQRGRVYGGIFNRTPEMPPPNWLSYIRVADVKSVAEQVKSLGGRVMAGPMQVPGGDWVAVCVDPLGAGFALHAK